MRCLVEKTWNLLFESLIKAGFPGTVKRWFLNAPANAPVSLGQRAGDMEQFGMFVRKQE